MGRKHRENRKNIKSMFRKANIPKGWRENEFGELVFRGYSKTDVRKILLYKLAILRQQQFDVIKLVQQKAIEAIQEQEDARVFNAIFNETKMYDEASCSISQ